MAGLQTSVSNITEKTDALAIVISEQTGEISYVKDGIIANYKSQTELNKLILEDLSYWLKFFY